MKQATWSLKTPSMPVDYPSPLPDDPDVLRAIIVSQQSLLAERDQFIQEQAKLLKVIARLQAQIKQLRRQLYGQKSERLEQELAQAEQALEELEAQNSALLPPQDAEGCQNETEAQSHETEAQPKGQDKQASSKPKSGAKSPPADLERVNQVYQPDQIQGDEQGKTSCPCPGCGGKLSRLGEDVHEVLDYVPARFRVIRHRRPKYSCRGCETIHQAPAPVHPVQRGKASPGLLAHLLISKYQHHLPLYRQADIYAQQGLALNSSTLADWVGQMFKLFDPLLDRLKANILASDRLHADDTPVKVLAPGTGKTKTGRLWVYLRDQRPHQGSLPPAVFYAYSPDRKQAHPKEHLQGFKGILQADAYPGFQQFYQDQGEANPRMIEAACWAHWRRKFYEIAKSSKKKGLIAHQVLAFIRDLYAIEAEINGLKATERLARRQAKSKPIVEALMAYLQEVYPKLSPKSATALAIDYGLSRWTSFTLFLDHPTVAIDNNAAERAVRPVAVGRKNWLFAGSDIGGERAAGIYSLIETAKLNAIDPFTYLRDVIARISEHPVQELDQLLPWNWG